MTIGSDMTPKCIYQLETWCGDAALTNNVIVFPAFEYLFSPNYGPYTVTYTVKKLTEMPVEYANFYRSDDTNRSFVEVDPTNPCSTYTVKATLLNKTEVPTRTVYDLLCLEGKKQILSKELNEVSNKINTVVGELFKFEPLVQSSIV